MRGFTPEATRGSQDPISRDLYGCKPSKNTAIWVLTLYKHTHTGVNPLKYTHIAGLRFPPSRSKKDPFPSNLRPHIRGKMVWSRPPGRWGQPAPHTWQGPTSAYSRLTMETAVSMVTTCTCTSMQEVDPQTPCAGRPAG